MSKRRFPPHAVCIRMPHLHPPYPGARPSSNPDEGGQVRGNLQRHRRRGITRESPAPAPPPALWSSTRGQPRFIRFTVAVVSQQVPDATQRPRKAFHHINGPGSRLCPYIRLSLHLKGCSRMSSNEGVKGYLFLVNKKQTNRLLGKGEGFSSRLQLP